MILSREAVERFPEIRETKQNFFGVSKTFTCRRLAGDADHVIVLHVLENEMMVANVRLPSGTLTFGHFWRDRPYNVYHWLAPQGATLGYYFNVAEGTVLSAEHIHWRDLVLDVLVLPGVAPQVLDREELPAALAASDRAGIEAGLTTLLHELPELCPALDARADDLWPHVFGGPREKSARP